MYVHFGAEGTAALTTDGAIVWKARFSYESQHGSGGSPILYGDLLIVSCDGGDAAFVVAIDKRTGKTRWKTSRRQPWDQAYTTPLVIRVGDARSDRERWRVPRRGVRSANGQGDLARQLRRRLLERASSRLRSRLRLHRHRIPAADDHRCPARRHRRRVEDARRVDAATRRAADTVAAASSETSSSS